MEIIGKLIRILPDQSGETAKGRWVRGGFVIETAEQYPRMVAFTMFGEDRVGMVKSIPLGTQINVHFSPESREFQDRWYTDLRCFRIDTFNPAPMGGGYPGQQPNYNPGVAPQPQATQMPTQPAPDFASNPSSEMMGTDDDLPF
ncbi:MAG: DUF3127 domain-containing protein [Bacteroidales bacterium]|nr:DUF3127 domain-containing protein [Bacteroidales bacterium]